MAASPQKQWSETGQMKTVPRHCVERHTMELRATVSSCSVSLFGIRLDCEFWKHFTVYAFPWFFVARVGAPVFPFRTWYTRRKTQLYQPLAN
jgi:hypothetical protein